MRSQEGGGPSPSLSWERRRPPLLPSRRSSSPLTTSSSPASSCGTMFNQPTTWRRPMTSTRNGSLSRPDQQRQHRADQLRGPRSVGLRTNRRVRLSVALAALRLGAETRHLGRPAEAGRPGLSAVCQQTGANRQDGVDAMETLARGFARNARQTPLSQGRDTDSNPVGAAR